MYKIKRIMAISICVWLILSMIIILIPPKAQAPTVLPIATLGLNQSYQDANVSPNGTGWVEFTGTVSCVLNDATSAVVELQSTDTWDSSIVTPSSLTFSRETPEDKTFRVSVTAPLYTSRNIVGQVTVTGSVIMQPGDIYGTVQPSDGVTGRINILPYYGFSLHCNESSIDAEPGSEVAYEIMLRNEGNARDTFEISIINEDELIDKGFVISINDRRIELDEAMEHMIDINVIVPKDGNIMNKKFEIEVEVISATARDEQGVIISKTETLYLDLNGDNSGSNDGSSSGFLPGFGLMWIIAGILIVVMVNKRLLGRK
jgi:hypothetical protein